MRRSGLVALAQRAEIAASAKSSPRTGDHYHIDARIFRDTAERVVDGHRQLIIQRIQPVGAIHHQRGDAVVLPFQDHWSSLRRLRTVTHGDLPSVASSLMFFADARNEL